MFGASRGIAGSHLINLRRQNCSKKAIQASTSSLDSTSTADYTTNPNTTSITNKYVIPNFAVFEFMSPKKHRHHYERAQVKIMIILHNLDVSF